MSGLLPKLVAHYGEDRVVDVFEGTGIKGHAQTLRFGLYVVRNAFSQETSNRWKIKMEQQLFKIGLQMGSRSVNVKGSKLWYTTLQCTSKPCTCKYEYEGTAKNPLWNIERTDPFNDVCEWMNAGHHLPRTESSALRTYIIARLTNPSLCTLIKMD